MYFAQDPTASQVAEQLVGLIAQNADQHWYLLCDSAFDHDKAKETYVGVNCYDMDPMRDLAPAGPWLLPVHAPGGVASAIAARVAPWLRHCSARPMLSVIATPESAPSIAARWADLHMATTQDRQKYLLRIADTRCLPVLATTLQPPQWTAWAGAFTQWQIIDRTGKLAALPLPGSDVSAESAPLVLSDEQVDAIVQGCEADALIAFFDEHLPNVVPDMGDVPASEWHRKVVAMLAQARRHGISRLEDKVALLHVSFLTQGRSDTDPRVQHVLQTGEWQPGHLSDALLETGVLDE